jgi:hypothetical protein
MSRPRIQPGVRRCNRFWVAWDPRPSTPTYADGSFTADGQGAYAPIDFDREARLPDGGTARLAFSLAFATDPAMPMLANS